MLNFELLTFEVETRNFQSFQQLNHLEEVQLPEGLEKISAAAFYFCTALER